MFDLLTKVETCRAVPRLHAEPDIGNALGSRHLPMQTVTEKTVAAALRKLLAAEIAIAFGS